MCFSLQALVSRLSRALLPAVLAAGGCTSSSGRSDLARVDELTHPALLPPVESEHVDTQLEDDADLRKTLRGPLDADSAVRAALLANRGLRAQLRELGIARGQLLQAGLLPNPRAEAELLPERSSQLELRVEYDITRALLTPVRAEAYRADLEAARYRVAALVLDLSTRVRDGFVRVQAAQQQLALARQAAATLAAANSAAHALSEAGNLPALDLATREAASERAEVEVERIALDVARERERFTRTLGLSRAAPNWQVNTALPAVPQEAFSPDDVERRALRANLDLRGEREHLIALARRAGFARAAGLIPDISVDVHALTGRVDDAAASDKNNWRFGGGVTVGLPLFDRQQGTALALDAAFRAGLERYYGNAADLRSRARELQARVQSAHLRARKYQDNILPAQRRVTEQTLLQYNAMQLGVFQLLSAQREQLEVQLAYVATLREYWSAVVDMHALLQGRHSGSSSGSEASELSVGAVREEHGS